MLVVIPLIALAAGCLLGWSGRYFLIEPDDVHALCALALPPGWCALRATLIAATFAGSWGYASVATAACAWLSGGRPARLAATLALFTGGLGLHLYDTGWAASGILAASLRLPGLGRPSPSAPPPTA